MRTVLAMRGTGKEINDRLLYVASWCGWDIPLGYIQQREVKEANEAYNVIQRVSRRSSSNGKKI